jgi:hypothetical protein
MDTITGLYWSARVRELERERDDARIEAARLREALRKMLDAAADLPHGDYAQRVEFEGGSVAVVDPDALSALQYYADEARAIDATPQPSPS